MARLPSQAKTIAANAEPWIYVEERRLRPVLERAFLVFLRGMKRSFTLDDLEKAMKSKRLNQVLQVMGVDEVSAKKLEREMVRGIKIAGKKAVEAEHP